MIQLASAFQSGMILQCGKPVRIWGSSDRTERVRVLLNGELIAERVVTEGAFSFSIPAQPAMENAVLTVGDAGLDHVDFGEVWIAGGQSNMQFYVKWDAERERLYKMPPDRHFRYFEAAKYTFDGEEKDGFKDASHWDKWFSFERDTCPYFSAVASWFALSLRRELGIPVGIVSCNLGATSASAWMDEKLLRADGELKCYTDEYDASLQGLDMARYEEANRFVRAYNAQGGEAAEDYLNGQEGITPQQFGEFLGAHAEQSAPIPFGDFSMEELTRPGPHDPHPGSLYRVMLQKIVGFSCRGVIWYQGCQDEGKAALYQKLFSALIGCWRRDWGEELPFVYAQLAPFGSWWGNTGKNFPLIRAAQAAVEQCVPGTYMVSTSDAGSEYDIHPKHKRPVGERMALRALDKIYQKPFSSGAPKFAAGEKRGDLLLLRFEDAGQLSIGGERLSALRVFADGKEAEGMTVTTEGNALLLRAKEFGGAEKIAVRFADTPYYCVDLYNEAGLPAYPFEFTWREAS